MKGTKNNHKCVILKLVILILVVGFFIGIYHIGKEDIWKDEAYNLHIAQKENIPDIINASLASVTHPPFGYIILHYWIKISGTSEMEIRLLSTFCGVLSILLVFLICKELGSEKVGLFASILMAFSKIQVIFSQDAKHYMLFAMFSLASTLFLIRYIKVKEPKYLIIYLLFILCSMYTHFLTIILLVIHNLIVMVFLKNRKHWFYAQSVMAILLIPWLLSLYKLILFEMKAFPALMLDRGLPLIIANKIFVFLITPIIMMATFAIVAIMLKKNVKILNVIDSCLRNNQVFLIFFIVLTLGIYLDISYNVTEPRNLIKYSFFLLPYFYIVEGYLINSIKYKKISLILISIIIIVSSFCIYNFYETDTKDRMSQIAEFVEQNQNPDDLIIYSGDLTGLAFKYYYRGYSELIDGLSGEEFSEDFATKNPTGAILVGSEDKIRQKIEGKKGVWVIYQSDYNGLFEKMMEDNLKDILEKVYEKKYLTIKLDYYKVED